MTDLTLETFRNSDRALLFTDKTGKKLFREILRAFQISFDWSTEHQGKMPDVLFKNGDDLFIVEHKHMKEGGGGQDKQATEVIDFIRHSEANPVARVHYVTFLDGHYFNLLASATGNAGKLALQLNTIRNHLAGNNDNYFVNTAGFHELLS